MKVWKKQSISSSKDIFDRNTSREKDPEIFWFEFSVMKIKIKINVKRGLKNDLISKCYNKIKSVFGQVI